MAKLVQNLRCGQRQPQVHHIRPTEELVKCREPGLKLAELHEQQCPRRCDEERGHNDGGRMKQPAAMLVEPIESSIGVPSRQTHVEQVGEPGKESLLALASMVR